MNVARETRFREKPNNALNFGSPFVKERQAVPCCRLLLPDEINLAEFLQASFCKNNEIIVNSTGTREMKVRGRGRRDFHFFWQNTEAFFNSDS